MHRLGVELAISRSQVRRPNHYTSAADPSTPVRTAHVCVLSGVDRGDQGGHVPKLQTSGTFQVKFYIFLQIAHNVTQLL